MAERSTVARWKLLYEQSGTVYEVLDPLDLTLLLAFGKIANTQGDKKLLITLVVLFL